MKYFEYSVETDDVQVLDGECHYFYVKAKLKRKYELKIRMGIFKKEVYAGNIYYIKLLGWSSEMISNVPDNWEKMWLVLHMLELFTDLFLIKSIL